MQYSLEELSVGKLQYGSGASAIPFDGVTRYVRITDIDEDGNLNLVPVSPNILEPEYSLTEGDILFARTGATVGKTYQYHEYDGKCQYAGYLIRMIPNTELVRSDYIWFFTKSPQYWRFIQNSMKVVAQPNINAKQYGALRIDVPSLGDQDAIIDRLSKLLKVINLRKRQILNCDRLIKARFVEIFGEPCSNSKGHVKMSIKEAVDAGYIEKPLDGNHGEKHPKASEYVDEGVPFVMANNLANGVVDYDSCSKITRERADKLDKGFSHDGDVLITHKGTIGRTAIVHTKLDYIMLTPQVTYYRPLKGIKAEYLKGYFDTDYFQGEMKKLAAAGGSTRAYVGITNQTQLQLLIPSQDLQIQYSEFVEQVDKSKVAIQKSLDETQLLFDSLMQKYFG